MDIGNKIKQLRQKSSFTQEQLASKLGVSAQSVSKWENAISMPDIVLLPTLAEVFGVSVDDLFDLTTQDRLRRIENRMDKQEELSGDIFKEYEEFLLDEIAKDDENYKATSLLAHLYHHRMLADAKKVQKYAHKAIMMCPEKKDCQWLLNMAQGQNVWDWNVANHQELIGFYKQVIESDHIEPKTPLPYYYLVDNLLADNRVREAEKYIDEFSMLPSHNKVLVPTYKAHIALLEHDEKKAQSIIDEGLKTFANNGIFLFEVAQFYAYQAKYDKALEYYEKSWVAEEGDKPRFYDALEGIATIYSIMGDKKKVVETYDRIIKNLKEEWKYQDDDLSIIDFVEKKRKLIEK